MAFAAWHQSQQVWGGSSCGESAALRGGLWWEYCLLH